MVFLKFVGILRKSVCVYANQKEAKNGLQQSLLKPTASRLSCCSHQSWKNEMQVSGPAHASAPRNKPNYQDFRYTTIDPKNIFNQVFRALDKEYILLGVSLRFFVQLSDIAYGGLFHREPQSFLEVSRRSTHTYLSMLSESVLT